MMHHCEPFLVNRVYQVFTEVGASLQMLARTSSKFSEAFSGRHFNGGLGSSQGHSFVLLSQAGILMEDWGHPRTQPHAQSSLNAGLNGVMLRQEFYSSQGVSVFCM